MEHRPPGQASAPERPDHPAAAALRFGLEIAAWVAIYYLWGWAAMVISILLLALFNKAGDKQFTGIAVPGLLRALLEFGILLAGARAMSLWLGTAAGTVMYMAIILLIVLGRDRYRWLLTA